MLFNSIVSEFKLDALPLEINFNTIKQKHSFLSTKMSQYPYTGPYSNLNQPPTGTGVGSTGLGTGTGYSTTGLGTQGVGSTGLGTGTTYSTGQQPGYGTTGLGTTGLSTGLHTGYTSTDPHYIPSSTTGTHNIQN